MYSWVSIPWLGQNNYHSVFCFVRKKKSRGKVISQAVTIANRNAPYDYNFHQQRIYVQPTPDHSSLTFQNNNAIMTNYEMQKMQ